MIIFRIYNITFDELFETIQRFLQLISRSRPIKSVVCQPLETKIFQINGTNRTIRLLFSHKLASNEASFRSWNFVERSQRRLKSEPHRYLFILESWKWLTTWMNLLSRVFVLKEVWLVIDLIKNNNWWFRLRLRSGVAIISLFLYNYYYYYIFNSYHQFSFLQWWKFLLIIIHDFENIMIY